MSTPRFQNRRRLWIAGATVGALSAISAGLLGFHPGEVAATPAAAPQAMPVSVATVTAREIETWQEFSGRLEAVERVDIRPRVAGTVLAVHFREGSLVRKDDLLVSIDPAPFEAEVDQADARVVAAQARVAYTRSEEERAHRLWDVKAIAERELEERVNARRGADADLRAAQAALQSARLNLGYTKIRAPIAGRVGKVEITVGNLIAAGPGAPVLTTLVSVNPIYASFEADEKTVAAALADLPPGVAKGSATDRIPVLMGTHATPDLPYAGRLQFIDNQVDARSGTVRLRAVFDNPDGALMPGQFARLQMGKGRSETALLINERAIGTDQSKRFVMVVGEDNTAAYREVTLGSAVDGLRVVTTGLQAGERIVVNGLQRVRPGTPVQPQAVDMAAKPELTARNPGEQRS